MLLSQNGNLLPKRLTDRVALKTIVSQHLLSKVRGLRKLPQLSRSSKFTRIFLGALAVLYFSGYQPVMAIPPVRQATAEASFTQQQDIEAANFSEPFILPHPGYISTRYSSWHPGIDIATGYGMPVHPIATGIVEEAVFGFFGLGHYVVISHEQGFKSTYGHMGKIFVRKGDSVNSASILGEVGMTGRTTGPHTHLEVARNSQYVDPMTILPTLTDWPTTGGEPPRGAGNSVPQKNTYQTDNKPKASSPKLSLIDIKETGQANQGKKQENKLTRLFLPLQSK